MEKLTAHQKKALTVQELLVTATWQHNVYLVETEKEQKKDKAHIAYLKGFIKGLSHK